MNYATIKSYDVANGPGVRSACLSPAAPTTARAVLNAEAWDFNYGQPTPLTPEVEDQIMAYLEPWYIRGFFPAKREPFEQKPGAVSLMRRDPGESTRKDREAIPVMTTKRHSGR